MQAPPGAGKSTGLPLAVMDAAPQFLQGKKIVMLQPRRLAARAAAQRMAFLLNERLGERVGAALVPTRIRLTYLESEVC